jgi:plastocyanin
MHNRILSGLAALSLISVAACGGGKDAATTTEDAKAPSAAPGAAPSVALTGDTIIVEMITDGTGNYYKPKEIEAHRGDVVRYVLKMGVHNVHFLPDSNTIKTGLPPASELLQLPGQTYDFVVDLQQGEYYFQCDPHAALGMKGKLEVEDES